MHSADEVRFVLEVILALGPLAVYFLGLGLVNSQPRPCMVRARADFVLLALAFVPVMVLPVVGLIERGELAAAGVVVMLVAGLFVGLLPKEGSAWVVYNVSPSQCRRLVLGACRRLGWSPAWERDRLRVAPAGLVVSQQVLPMLRNVTVRIGSADGVSGAAAARARSALVEALRAELEGEAMLPSPAGASLVLVGACLLGMPMWYLFRHMDAIVDLVQTILWA